MPSGITHKQAKLILREKWDNKDISVSEIISKRNYRISTPKEVIMAMEKAISECASLGPAMGMVMSLTNYGANPEHVKEILSRHYNELDK